MYTPSDEPVSLIWRIIFGSLDKETPPIKVLLAKECQEELCDTGLVSELKSSYIGMTEIKKSYLCLEPPRWHR
jgi:hypothetical protein